MKAEPDMIISVLSNPQSGAVLLGAFIGVAGSVLVALVTGLINRGKFKRELLWEKRQSACNDIVSRLLASSKFGDRIRDGFSEDERGFYDSEELRKLDEKYSEEIDAAHAAFQANYLILPSAFRKRYERLDREHTIAWYDFPTGPEAYLYPIYRNEAARRDLFDLARAELGIVSRWKWVVIRWRPAFGEASLTTRRLWRRMKRWTRSLWRGRSEDW